MKKFFLLFLILAISISSCSIVKKKAMKKVSFPQRLLKMKKKTLLKKKSPKISIEEKIGQQVMVGLEVDKDKVRGFILLKRY